MKNQYLEVEILPLHIVPEENPGFVIRHLEKDHQSPAKPSILKTISVYLAQASLVFALVLFPLFSSGQTTMKQEIIRLTNIERQKHHLAPLVINSQLENAAIKKAQSMGENNYFSHTSPDGLKPWDFISAEDYSYAYAGENLAMDFSASDKIVKAWLASPSHRENLLDKNFKEMGLAVIEAKIKNHQTTLVVQMFGQEK